LFDTCILVRYIKSPQNAVRHSPDVDMSDPDPRAGSHFGAVEARREID